MKSDTLPAETKHLIQRLETLLNDPEYPDWTIVSKETLWEVVEKLASAAQPTDAVVYGLEAWVDGVWHLQWPLRSTEAGAEQDRAMYAADTKLRLVRLSAAPPEREPHPPHRDCGECPWGGEICANCGAVKGTRRGNATCGEAAAASPAKKGTS